MPSSPSSCAAVAEERLTGPLLDPPLPPAAPPVAPADPADATAAPPGPRRGTITCWPSCTRATRFTPRLVGTPREAARALHHLVDARPRGDGVHARARN